MLVPRCVALLLLAILVAGCGGPDADEPARAPAAERAADPARARQLQETLDGQRDGYSATGMAAAIVIRGQLFWAGGSGLANRSTNEPVAANTPFPIFSITKTFVAALAVKLAEEGELDLDDPLSGAVPDWPNAERITLRMLLNQTSGIAGVLRPASPLERAVDARPRAMWTPRRTLSYHAGRPRAAPGERWEYNNANYILAGLLIEQATGRTVAEGLRELILEPLDLDDTVLQPQERPRGEPARGYGGPPRVARALRTGGRYAPYPSEVSSAWTAGAMVSNAPSVARFADALLRGNLLSADSREELLRFVLSTDYTGYGLGVGKLGTPSGGEMWGHFGRGPGFVTSVWHMPAEEITVAVLSSGDVNLYSLTHLLADVALYEG